MSYLSTDKILKSSDGTVIFARAVGQPDRPSLVFVHGLALSGIVFDDLFKNQDLLDRFYLVSYDMRGHGRSGKPDTIEGHASNLYADDFVAVVNAFGLQSPLFVGWSLGATVACDICANLEPGAISGIVYAAGMPYLGPVTSVVGKPFVLGCLPGLYCTDNVNVSVETKVAFVDSVFTDPDSVPIHIKWAWLGSATVQYPAVSRAVLGRIQDPEKLYEAGSNGLPLLLVYGTEDKHLDGEAADKWMRPHFKDFEVHFIQEGSHSPFYDNEEEFVGVLVNFASRVFSK
ncbi:Non-heme chloroperoxidase [Psilocybe cubensis]|uniref:AB hydrolase-1 domain-containing protein n=2 Tax=Psilocybe cubensis TaxID=181762 RepID=A0A8H8CEU8_PSICU|nr:Non-heme chloroperoxidase [Psilocybe cubensis]KAH9483247.1 Non-heme chloroperoxidase [Psilocybe cubensis]